MGRKSSGSARPRYAANGQRLSHNGLRQFKVGISNMVGEVRGTLLACSNGEVSSEDAASIIYGVVWEMEDSPYRSSLDYKRSMLDLLAELRPHTEEWGRREIDDETLVRVVWDKVSNYGYLPKAA